LIESGENQELPYKVHKDFRASRVIESTWPHHGNTVQVTVIGGQALQDSSIDKNQTVQWRQERILKTVDARRRKPQGPKLIEEPRWKLLKHWYSSSEVIANWNQQWVKADEWGKMGGHTSLVDYFRVTITFQDGFNCCTVSYCGPLLAKFNLVVRGNDN